jgi:hypothetical protein
MMSTPSPTLAELQHETEARNQAQQQQQQQQQQVSTAPPFVHPLVEAPMLNENHWSELNDSQPVLFLWAQQMQQQMQQLQQQMQQQTQLQIQQQTQQIQQIQQQMPQTQQQMQIQHQNKRVRRFNRHLLLKNSCSPRQWVLKERQGFGPQLHGIGAISTEQRKQEPPAEIGMAPSFSPYIPGRSSLDFDVIGTFSMWYNDDFRILANDHLDTWIRKFHAFLSF